MRESLFLKKPTYNQMKLSDLRLHLHLGWPEEERRQKQVISVYITLKFASMPQGCETDDLAGTVCYAELTQKITAHCQQKSYRLIEHLAYDIYQQIKILHAIDCQVTVWKQPAIENLQGGASFVCGDWE